jgi:hypothetical protein
MFKFHAFYLSQALSAIWNYGVSFAQSAQVNAYSYRFRLPVLLNVFSPKISHEAISYQMECYRSSQKHLILQKLVHIHNMTHIIIVFN